MLWIVSQEGQHTATIGRHLPEAASRNQRTGISLDQVSSGDVRGMAEMIFVWDREPCNQALYRWLESRPDAGRCGSVWSARKRSPLVHRTTTGRN